MTSYITMYDAVDISQIPSNPAAVAGYVDGAFQTAHVLAARFPHLITFPRYTAAQLAAIFAALAGEAGFALTTAAAGKAAAVLEQADAGPASGGARLAVRLLDQATARQARRVTAAAQPLPPAALGTVEATDIPGHLQPHPFGPTDDPGPGQYL